MIFGRGFTGKGLSLRQPIGPGNSDDKILTALKAILLAMKTGEELRIEIGENPCF